MADYIFTVRNTDDNITFNDAVGDTTYLIIPDDADDIALAHKADTATWVKNVRDSKQEDILIFIHGYNNTTADMLAAHRAVKKGLAAVIPSSYVSPFKGKVVSFDWPCRSSALMYLPDRHLAKITALELVNGGIALLSQKQAADCDVNVHLLAHSTGAFVVREAFDDAKHTKAVLPDWMVTQIMFIAGDISSNSMACPGQCDAIYQHTVRLTNYYNPFDKVLALSNLKRLGFENRAGRIGLPASAPAKCVDVNCADYYNTIPQDGKDEFYCHSWYFDNDNNKPFMEDLLGTIQGHVDRNYMPARKRDNDMLMLIDNYK
jgi:esterase/lipase superfamily enzyme